MVRIPQPAWSCIMSYLHREYDHERQEVLNELANKCTVFGDGFECLELVPQLLLPTRCMLKNVERWYA